MPLIISPRQLSQRSDLYHQLGSLVAAGIGLIYALETVRNSPPSRHWRGPLDQLLTELNKGATFSDALASVGRGWFPAFDRALLAAGEQSGRLDSCFRFLSNYYSERATLARQIVADLAYPLVILHVAVLVFPPAMLTQLVLQGDVVGFLIGKVLVLAPIYGVVAFLIYIGQAAHGENWRYGIETLVKRVPVLGSARGSLALARLSMALESLLNAGVTVVEAWELAAAASGSPALRRTVFNWRDRVLAGQTPAEAVRESRAFPELFENLYSTGELSGHLDDSLRRLRDYYQEDGLRKLREVARWVPRFIYFVLALLIAWQVIAFWSRYYSQIGGMAF